MTLTLEKPSLTDNTADVDRFLNGLRAGIKYRGGSADIHFDIDLALVKRIPHLLREWDYSVTCILFRDDTKWVVVEVLPPEISSPPLGVAIDLGTTRVVLRLIDLRNGDVLTESSFNNPQIAIGPDVLARIHFSSQPDGLKKLNDVIVEGLNTAIRDMCQALRVDIDTVYLMAIAGNTTMTHLFLGLDPYWIIREPYIPVVNTPGVRRAGEIGLNVHSSARILIFPNIGSYFGGDLIAGILYSGLNRADETAILVDVGTNAEVVLGNRDWMMACAGAAGPALEGGVTKMGMMAGPGVIDRITVTPDGDIRIHTIQDEQPKGICGSGLIDLAAGLFMAKMVDIRGKFTPAECGDRLYIKDEINHFVVVPADVSATGEALTISQADLDSLVRSKAAMYTILETITASVGMALNDLPRFYVAGTFGSFIRPESAIAIGMIPDLPIECYKALGNSSLGGAQMIVSCPEYFDQVDYIRNQITYMELNVNQEFMNLFSAAKFLPHTNPALFPSVKRFEG